jgi:hypothetical protein
MVEKTAKAPLAIVGPPTPLVGAPGTVPPPPPRELGVRHGTLEFNPERVPHKRRWRSSFYCKPAKPAIGSRGCAPALKPMAR